MSAKRTHMPSPLRSCFGFRLLAVASFASATVRSQHAGGSTGLTDGWDYSLELPDLRALLLDTPVAQLKQLAAISDHEDSLVRTFLSPAHKLAAQQIQEWLQQAGMHTWTDGLANVHGRVGGRNLQAPALLLGSHYDTVLDAGRYDGALGVIVAIAAVKTLLLQAARTSQVDFRHNLTTSTNLHEVLNGKQHELLASPVEIIAFSDEEGIRQVSVDIPWQPCSGR